MLAAAAAKAASRREGRPASDELDAAPARVLVVYGSETGNTRRAVQRLVHFWRAQCDGSYAIGPADVVAGNDFQLSLAELAAAYDVLIVATSSFGEGDPPENFVGFLLKLTRGAQAGGTPLVGMQHAVLGFGASVYPTFQNCPRLTDKLLGELGSRRLARRVELDEDDEMTAAELDERPDTDVREGGSEAGREEGEHSPPSAPGVAPSRRQGLNKFMWDVHVALQLASGSAGQPEVCSWRWPGDRIVAKSEADLRLGRPEVDRSAARAPLLAVLALGLAASVASDWFFERSGKEAWVPFLS